MVIRNIENLTAIGRTYDKENPIFFMVDDVIKFTYNNGAEIEKTIIEQGVVDYPTEKEIKEASLIIEAKKWSPSVKTTEELKEEAREWRDYELSYTDNVAQTPDYPNRNAILAYRQELRDWPSTFDFPNIKPVAPVGLK